MQTCTRLVTAAIMLALVAGSLSCGSRDDSGASPAVGATDSSSDSGDGAGAAGSQCEQGALKCMSGTEAAICQDGKWTVSQACRSGQLCFEGRCLTPEPCTPGTVDGCFSANAARRCNEAESAYEPADCEAGELCVLGECKVTDCAPGQARCADQRNREVCGPKGEWEAPKPCGEGHNCTAGRCLSGCRSDPKFTHSSVGFEYWTVDLDQGDKSTLGLGHTPPAEGPHSVVLSNPGEHPVVVSFTTRAAGITLPWVEETIGPGEVREVFEARDPDRPFYLLIVGDAQVGSLSTSVFVPAPLERIGWDPGYEAAVQARHAAAMDKIADRTEVPVAGGAFEGEIVVPKDMPTGVGYLKVLVENQVTDGIGHAPVTVLRGQ